MNVTTITEPKAVARRRLQSYRAAIHRKADAEYVAVERAYRELANGRPLINLVEAIQSAPLDEKGRPRLAIARADRPQVHLRMAHERVTFDVNIRWRRGRSRRLTAIPVALPSARMTIPDGYALVPMVPPEVKKHHALGNCHVLWEVEQWADSEIRATPDRDPFLVRYIGGDLWAVLGEWDLTEVERAVMAGRRTQ